jgi:hypothetical protein
VILDSGDLGLYDIRTRAKGPTGSLPLTAEMLLTRPSGDLFGLTQDAGMGWDPSKLSGKEFLILSTHGGIRAADGTPVALGYHTGHWEVGLLMQAAAEELKSADAVPFAAYCTILAFVLIEALLFQVGVPDAMIEMLGRSRYSWLIVLLAFMGVSTLAQKWAQSDASSNMQYLGLGIYVVAEAFIFAPLLWLAQYMSDRNDAGPIIMPAAFITLLLFTGLTYTAFTTKKDSRS